MLSEDQIQRYSRQLILSEWSAKKQLRLGSLRVLADHEVSARYLAAAGVGTVLLSGAGAGSIDELKLLSPGTSFLPFAAGDSVCDSALLHEAQASIVPSSIPTFLIGAQGIFRALGGERQQVLAFPCGFFAADVDQLGGFSAVALGVLALLRSAAEEPNQQ